MTCRAVQAVTETVCSAGQSQKLCDLQSSAGCHSFCAREARGLNSNIVAAGAAFYDAALQPTWLAN